MTCSLRKQTGKRYFLCKRIYELYLTLYVDLEIFQESLIMQCPLSSYGWSSEFVHFSLGSQILLIHLGLILTLTEHTFVVIYLRITCQPKK